MHEGFKVCNSRTGAGPIETILFRGPETGLRILQNTTRLHFDENRLHNGFGWVTASWENCLEHHSAQYGYEPNEFLGKLTEWLRWVRARWPDAQMPALGEFGLQWRAAHPCNNFAYRFDEDGTPDSGPDADKHIRWYMNPKFRWAVLWPKNQPEKAQVLDCTRYDLPAREPQGLQRNWSLLGQINQKQTRPQDKPVPLAQCDDLVRACLTEVGFEA
jgi:hypothetical protein